MGRDGEEVAGVFEAFCIRVGLGRWILHDERCVIFVIYDGIHFEFCVASKIRRL